MNDSYIAAPASCECNGAAPRSIRPTPNFWHAIHFRNGASRVALDDKIERNSELLASHRMVKELTKSRRHACPQCDYKTGNVSHLRRHLRTLHKQAPPVPPPMPPPVPPPMPPSMPPQQLGGAALLNLVQPGKGNNVTLTIASF